MFYFHMFKNILQSSPSHKTCQMTQPLRRHSLIHCLAIHLHIVGLVAVFATFYVLNLEYLDESARTLEFVQRLNFPLLFFVFSIVDATKETLYLSTWQSKSTYRYK